MADVAQAGWRPHPWAAEGQRRLRFGIFGGPLDDWPALVDWVQTAEALGFDSFWLPDHPVFAPDCWTTMAALAGVTTRIRLGPLVACAGYRHPLLLARQAADVDRLSGGRLVSASASATTRWSSSSSALALDLPARQRVLEETIRAVYGRWGAAPFPLQGRDSEDAAGPPATRASPAAACAAADRRRRRAGDAAPGRPLRRRGQLRSLQRHWRRLERRRHPPQARRTAGPLRGARPALRFGAAHPRPSRRRRPIRAAGPPDPRSRPPGGRRLRARALHRHAGRRHRPFPGAGRGRAPVLHRRPRARPQSLRLLGEEVARRPSPPGDDPVA